MTSPKQPRANKNRRALGRGLDALFQPSAASSNPDYKANSVFVCGVERIRPCRDQPRRIFDEEKLEELAATIKEHGLIQPIVVRRSGDDRFEIIAGERRWRAAQRAGKLEVPVVVKDVSPDAAFELALIENLQRADLNPLEVAEAYKRLLSDHSYTQSQLGERVGKSRVAITNVLRLLKLPDSVRQAIGNGELSEGHGRALLALKDSQQMERWAEKAIRGRLSVRRLEAQIRSNKPGKNKSTGPAPKSANVRDLEHRLMMRTGVKSSIEQRGKGGRITLHYGSLDELDALLERLNA
jgi:ParB family transcriptional regulator, chromosome partitioning protein